MSEKVIKLGEVIDDYCSRCRLILNHGVVSLVEQVVKRVRCNTCMNEHAYRRGKLPRKKKDPTQDLFDQVLARIPEPTTRPPVDKPARRRTPHLGARLGPPPEEPSPPDKPPRRVRKRRRR